MPSSSPTRKIPKRLGQRVGHLTPLFGANALLDALISAVTIFMDRRQGALALGLSGRHLGVKRLEEGMREVKPLSRIALLGAISLLASSCATTVKTAVIDNSDLAKIRSFSAVEVAELRDSDVVSKALASGLREKGFRVERGVASDEGSAANTGIKLGTDGIIYGYVMRIEHDSWVTRGEERVRVRETATGTEERIRYDPPKVITSKTVHVRIKALDEMGAKAILDTEGFISDDSGADTVYMIESIVEKMLEQLPAPPADAASAPEAPQPQDVAVGEKAPNFVAEAVDGERIVLSEYRNSKIVVLNFWGVRCLPCLQEMPKLEHIYRKYKDQGMEMLGVNVDGVGSDIIRRSLRKQIGGVELNVTYPLLLDLDFSIIDTYYLTVAPLTLVIDKEGVIRYMHIDYQPGDEIELEEAIKQVLSG